MLRPKPEPANLETPIEEITEHNLLYRLLIGVENSSGTKTERDKEIIKLPEAVHQFMTNEDHGLPHSKLVLKRCREVIASCPKLMLNLSLKGLGPIEIEELITWASVLHDFARFLGYKTIPEHQIAGANLARLSFGMDPGGKKMSQYLMEMLICHDYLCPLIDGEELPNIFKGNPLAEIFRLADKTSLPPAEELNRYYLTGKRYGGDFYHPMPWVKRIDFTRNYQERDWLTFFLILFAIQPKDFYWPETQVIYNSWAKEKPSAANKIIELARLENLPESEVQEISKILSDFHRLTGQPDPFNQK